MGPITIDGLNAMDVPSGARENSDIFNQDTLQQHQWSQVLDKKICIAFVPD